MEAVLAFLGMYLVGRYYVKRKEADPIEFEAWVAWGEGYNAGWGDSMSDKTLDIPNVDPFDYKPTYWGDDAFLIFKQGYLAGWSDHNAERTFYSSPNPYNEPVDKTAA